LKIKVSQCHFVHHKAYVEWPGMKPVPPQVSDKLLTARY